MPKATKHVCKRDTTRVDVIYPDYRGIFGLLPHSRVGKTCMKFRIFSGVCLAFFIKQ